MRDERFVAVHRGGLLSKEDHRQLMGWARVCAEHVAPLAKDSDERLSHALHIAKEWQDDKVPTSAAMKASYGAHAAARDLSDPVSVTAARSIGQAVATAHMADHCVGAALYALKTVKRGGKSVTEEKAWQAEQLQQLPANLAELVLSTISVKAKGLEF